MNKRLPDYANFLALGILTLVAVASVSNLESVRSDMRGGYAALFVTESPVSCKFISPANKSFLDQDTDIVSSFAVAAYDTDTEKMIEIDEILNINADGKEITSETEKNGMAVTLREMINIGWSYGKHNVRAALKTENGYCMARTEFRAYSKTRTPKQMANGVVKVPLVNFNTLDDLSKYTTINKKEFGSGDDIVELPISLIFPYFEDVVSDGEYPVGDKTFDLVNIILPEIERKLRMLLETYGYNKIPVKIKLVATTRLPLGNVPERGTIVYSMFTPIFRAENPPYDRDDYQGVAYMFTGGQLDPHKIRSKLKLPRSLPIFILDHLVDKNGDKKDLQLTFRSGIIIAGYDKILYDSANYQEPDAGVHDFLFYEPTSYRFNENYHNIFRAQTTLHELGHALGLGHNTANSENLMFPYIQFQFIPALSLQQTCSLKATAAWDFEYDLGKQHSLDNPPLEKSCGDGLLDIKLFSREECEYWFWTGFMDVDHGDFPSIGFFYPSCVRNEDPAIVCTEENIDKYGTCMAMSRPSWNTCYKTGVRYPEAHCTLEISCGNKKWEPVDKYLPYEKCDYSDPDSIREACGPGYDTCYNPTHDGPGCTTCWDNDGELPPIDGDGDSAWAWIRRWGTPIKPTPTPPKRNRCMCEVGLTHWMALEKNCDGANENICTNDFCIIRDTKGTVDPEDDTTFTRPCGWH